MRLASVALLCAALTVPSIAGTVPRPAPEFSVMLPGGKPLPIKSMKGKIVILTFIYTTCSHCQHLTGELAAIQREYADKGVQVIETAYNEGVNDKLVADFVDQFHPGFPVGFDDRASVYTFLQISILAKMVYVPHVILIDRQGVIRGDYPGESDFMKSAAANLRAELDKLVKASPVPAAARPSAKALPKKK